MNVTVFTVEEENLICIYDTASRTALINSITAALSDFNEPDMNEIAENVLSKLDAMTDEEFSAITFAPAYDDDETEG
jgi:hypothetical protein